MNNQVFTDFGVFTDFHEYSESLQNYDIELFQLNKEKFEGKKLQIFSSEIIIHHNQIKGKIHMRGSAPRGFLNFGVPIRTQDRAIWKGKISCERSMLVYPAGVELDCTSSTDFYAIDISISEELLKRTAALLEIDSIDSFLKKESHVICDTEAKMKLVRYLLNISNEFNRTPMNLDSKTLIKELNVAIPEMLIDIMISSNKLVMNRHSNKRRYAIKKINEVLHENEYYNYSIPELCRLVGVSQRTLEYAVKDIYDITPIQLINNMRLNRVRKTIRESDNNRKNITDIANQFGFWHMGKFANDYKNLFGQLPSETTTLVAV